MAGPSHGDLVVWAKRLEDRSYKTYLSRVKAYQRLKRRGNSWNASLIMLSTATTVASIGLLVNREMYGRGGDALLVALAVLSLVASLVVSAVSYGSRAQSMENSYKRIQQISVSAESIPEDPTNGYQRLHELRREYLIAVETSENHSQADFMRTSGVSGWDLWRRTWKDSIVGLAPYVTLVIPLALLIPFLRWFTSGL